MFFSFGLHVCGRNISSASIFLAWHQDLLNIPVSGYPVKIFIEQQYFVFGNSLEYQSPWPLHDFWGLDGNPSTEFIWSWMEYGVI